MSIKRNDLRLIGSAVMPENDVTTNIGGAADPTISPTFADVGDALQGVSSAAGDTTQTITVSYRDANGVIQTLGLALTGRTPVTDATVTERLLKAVKSATCAGDVAVEDQTATRTGTAQAFDTADTIKLDAGASAADDAYAGMVLRLTGGTGQYQIRRVLGYDGTTKIATVSRAWDTNPDNTSTFRVSTGFYFELAPTEVLTVRRLFYDSAADAPGGSARAFYEKVFFINTHGTLGLSEAIVSEAADPSTAIGFGLAASVDDTGDNGAFTRLTAPAGVVFDDVDADVPGGGVLAAGSAIGVWLKLTRLAGAAALKSSYSLGLTGTTT